MTREEALSQLKDLALSPEEAEKEFNRVAFNLEIPTEELTRYFNLPVKSYNDYKNQENLFNIGSKVLKLLGLERSIER